MQLCVLCVWLCTGQIQSKGMKTAHRVPLKQLQKTLQISVLQKHVHVLMITHASS